MKKVISLLSAVFIIIVSLSYSVQAYGGTCGDNLTWSYDEASRTLIIEGSGNMKSWRNNRLVPWHDLREEAEHISLPSGLTSIGDYAFFKFKKITEINIPSSVKTIGNGSISSCTSLISVTLPRGVESLGGWTFAGDTSLESISFPTTLKSINYECFLGCDKLMDVTIPSSVREIGRYSFGYGKSHRYYYDMILRAPSGSPAESYAANNLLNFVSTTRNSYSSELINAFTESRFDNDVFSLDFDSDGKITAKDLILSYKY